MFARMLCLAALLSLSGCAALDEGYSAHYGLTSTEYAEPGSATLDESYPAGTVGIQRAEEYEEKYREKRVLERAEPEEPAAE